MMKKETRTIITGISGTVLLLLLTLFTIYNGYKIKTFSDNFKNSTTAFKEDSNNSDNNSITTNTENNNNYNDTPTDNNTNNNNITNSSNSSTNYDYDKENARTVTIYLFRGEGCPHCETAIEYLKTIINDYNINIVSYEVWKNTNNRSLMQEVASTITTESITGVPFIVFDNGEYFVGFSETYGEKIKEKIATLSKEEDTNKIKNIIDNYTLEVSSEIIK